MTATYWAIALIVAFAIQAFIDISRALAADATVADIERLTEPMAQPRHQLVPEAPEWLALTAEPHCWEPAWKFNTQELRLFIASPDGEVVAV